MGLVARAAAAGRNKDAELDDATLERARRGEPEARVAFVRAYQDLVFAYLSRLVGARAHESVEDLAQETFVRVLEALPRYQRRPEARTSTWVLTIATHLAIDRLRAPGLRTLPVEDVHPDPAALPDERAAWRRAAAALYRAIDELGPEFRAAFLLHVAHGLSIEETAAALGVVPGTVKSRVSRARAALRAAIGEASDE
jgi:RNA polymerase sigma-70 factor, ECF subfamily